MKKIKRLYDDDGHWLDGEDVHELAKKNSETIRKMLKALYKEGWSRIDVERMMFDAVRFESTMLSLLKIAEHSEKKGKMLIRRGKKP